MSDHSEHNMPKISLIIPAKNEEAYLKACLDSVANQTVAPLEVIVVDNASTDKTKDIVRAYPNVTYIYESRLGLPQARQAGLEQATGDWLLYVDADSQLPPDYIAEMQRAIAESSGVVAVTNPSGFYDGTMLLNIFIRLFFFNFSLLERLRFVRFIFGGSFAVHKKTLETLGGFNTDIHFYGEDTDLTKRMQDAGRIVYLRHTWNKTSARRYREIGFWKTIWHYASVYLLISVYDIIDSIKSMNRAFLIRRVLVAFAIGIGSLSLYGFFSPASQVFGKTERHVVADTQEEKTIALTFDDGPNGQYTEQVLDLLEKEHIHATFFLIGKNALVYPDVVKRIADDGNVIGNHSYSHSFFLPFYQEKKAEEELAQTNDLLEKETGVTPTLFRPPHGWKTPRLLHAAKAQGMNVVLWNDMTTDYFKHAKADKIAKEILENVKPGGIIVLHDGLNLHTDIDREETITALQTIITTLKDQGYTFVTL